MDFKKRYMINLDLSEENRTVQTYAIVSEDDEKKFNNKLERHDYFVECNKDGVIIGNEDKEVASAYNTINTLKKEIESLMMENILIKQENLELKQKVEDYKLVIETSSEPVNDGPCEVVKPVKEDKPVVARKVTKKRKTTKKKTTTKK